MDTQVLLEKSRLDTYIDSVSEGFQKNTQETVIVLIAIVIIIAVTVLFFRWYIKRKTKKERQEYDRRYSSLSQKKKLTPTDNALLLELFRYAPKHTPGLISLITNPRFFSAAAKKFIAEHPGRQRQIASLRFRLGFQVPGNGSILVSSTGMEEGTSVLIKTKQNREIFARVSKVDARGFSVRAEEDMPIKGSAEIVLYMKSGMYSFDSDVLPSEDDRCILSHSELVRRTQKRSSLRKPMKTTLVVELPQKEAAGNVIKLRGKILDLSADGARISLPKCGIETGDSLIMTLFKNSGNSAKVAGQVVRLDAESGIVGVRFTDVGKKTRERIIEAVFH